MPGPKPPTTLFTTKQLAPTGSEQSSLSALENALIRKWINGGIHLEPVARIVRYAKNVPEDLLPLLAQVAIRMKDVRALEEVVPSLLARGDSLNPSPTPYKSFANLSQLTPTL